MYILFLCSLFIMTLNTTFFILSFLPSLDYYHDKTIFLFIILGRLKSFSLSQEWVLNLIKYLLHILWFVLFKEINVFPHIELDTLELNPLGYVVLLFSLLIYDLRIFVRKKGKGGEGEGGERICSMLLSHTYAGVIKEFEENSLFCVALEQI